MNCECAALSRLTLHRDTAAMRMDDLRADGEPDAGPLPSSFRGKKWVKDSTQILLGNSLAAIMDRSRHASPTGRARPISSAVACFFDRRFDVQFTASGHGIDGIRDQIQEYLLQLVAIRQYQRQVVLQLNAELDATA